MKRGAAQIIGTKKLVDYFLNPYYDDFGERHLAIELDRRGMVIIPVEDIIEILEDMEYRVEDVS